MSKEKVTFFMLVTNRDCMIADYAIKSYAKIFNSKKPFGNGDFVLFVYLNCLSDENKRHYVDKWASYPYTHLFDNATKIAAMDVKPFPGQVLLSPEGITRNCDDYAENYDELWTTELKKFTTPYIATVDADFEILHPDFYFHLINTLASDKSAIAASSCYGRSSGKPIYDSYSNRNIYLTERNQTWFCIYKRDAFELSKTSHYYFEEKHEDGETIAFDSAANFQNELRKLGQKFLHAPIQYNTSFVHYGASSKNKTLNRANIGYYRNAFILTNKGLLRGRNNLFTKLINKLTKKVSRLSFQKYLDKKWSERNTYVH